jgi:hypothetical protein
MTKKKRKVDGRCNCRHRAAIPAPPSGGDVISPARILANVLDNTFIGGEEEGVVMAVAELNGTTTTMTTTTLVCNAAAGKVVDNVLARRGYDEQQ